MVNFIILAIILSVISVAVIILKVLHNNDDTFDTLLRLRTERKRAGVSGYRRINNVLMKILSIASYRRLRDGSCGRAYLSPGRRRMYCGNGDNSDIHRKHYFKYPDG